MYLKMCNLKFSSFNIGLEQKPYFFKRFRSPTQTKITKKYKLL